MKNTAKFKHYNAFGKMSDEELAEYHSYFVTLKNNPTFFPKELLIVHHEYKNYYGSMALTKMEYDFLYECAVRFANKVQG